MLTRHNMMSLQGMLCLAIYSKGSGMRYVARNTGMSVDTINKYISEIEYISGQKVFNHECNKLVLTEYGKYITFLGKKIENILLNLHNYTKPSLPNSNFINLSLKGLELKIDTTTAILIYDQLQKALSNNFKETL